MSAVSAGKASAGAMARLTALEAQIATTDVVSSGNAPLMRVLRENGPVH